jgi:hypothetical protein
VTDGDGMRQPDVPPVSAEELVGDEPVEDEPRRYPSTIGGACYLLVLVVAAVALALVVWHDWRTGVIVLGADVIAAAAIRLVLPQKDAGMLEVRSKPLDAGILVLLGALLIFLATDIPNQPGT